MTKVFRARNGRTIDLGKDFEKATEYKHSIEAVFSESLYWLCGAYRPVFDSRGNYLGHTEFNGFKGFQEV